MDETIYKHIGVRPRLLKKQVYHTLYSPLGNNTHKHLIVNHGEDLLIYDSEAKKIIKQRNLNNANNPTDTIIKVLFSTRYRAIFLMRKSQLIDIYSEDLIELNTGISIKDVRHCLDWKFIENLSAFLVLTSECLKLVYLEINCNHLKSLFKNNYEFECQELGDYTLPPPYFLEFANCIIDCDRFLVLANSNDVKIIDFYRDPNVPSSYSKVVPNQVQHLDTTPSQAMARRDSRTVLHITGICSAPQQITKAVYNQSLNLLICGTIYGKILLYKINFSNIVATALLTTITTKIHINHKMHHEDMDKSSLKQAKQATYRLTVIPAKLYFTFKLDVHNFKQINHIQFHNQKIFFTVGADDYLQVISLDHMASIEKFRLSSKISQQDFAFISTNEYLAVTNDSGFQKNLYSYLLCLEYKMKWNHKSTIVESLYNDTNLVTVTTDNSLNWVNCNVYKPETAKDDPKSTKSFKFKISERQSKEPSQIKGPEEVVQAFVPKSCKTILCVTKNIFQSNEKSEEYWLLTSQGDIHKYKIQPEKNKARPVTITEQQSSSIKIHSFVDIYNHETNQKVLIMKFIDFVPIKFDSDIKEKKYKPSLIRAKEIHPIAFGCQTGEILICPTYDPLAPENVDCIHNVIMRIRSFGESVKSFSFVKIYGGDRAISFPNRHDLQTSQMSQPSEGALLQSVNILEMAEQKKQFEGKNRLLVLCSKNEIVVMTVSNYEAPTTLFKTLVTSPNSLCNSHDFFQKTLGFNFAGIVTGTQINIIFAYYPDYLQSAKITNDYPTQLCLYSNSSIVHQAPVTIVEHCSDITFISGDQAGKIAVWSMRSEIIAVLQINENVKIQCCFYFTDLNKIIFGYNSKVFESPLKRRKRKQDIKNKKKEERQDEIWKKLLQEEGWLKDSVTVLKKGGRSGSEQVGLGVLAKLMEKAMSRENKRKNLNSTNITPDKKYKTIEKSETINLPKISKHQGRQGLRSHRSTNNSIREEALSKIKVHRTRMQQNIFSEALLQPSSIMSDQLFASPQHPKHLNNSAPNKKATNSKNRNKIYEYLFHFPSSGLYQQLVHKNMLQ